MQVRGSARYVHGVGRLVLACLLFGVLTGIAACDDDSAESDTPAPLSGAEPQPAVVPEAPNLTSPESAVKSYTDWISYAYRVARSDVATHAFSMYEEVRVDSYIQYNKTENQQAIDQYVVQSDYRTVSQDASAATVAGFEEWRYRYIDIADGTYKGPEHAASYDVTYTVIVEPDRGWVVDRVEATARGEIP